MVPNYSDRVAGQFFAVEPVDPLLDFPCCPPHYQVSLTGQISAYFRVELINYSPRSRLVHLGNPISMSKKLHKINLGFYARVEGGLVSSDQARARVERLMGEMGLCAIYPKPKLSKPEQGAEHRI